MKKSGKEGVKEGGREGGREGDIAHLQSPCDWEKNVREEYKKGLYYIPPQTLQYSFP